MQLFSYKEINDAQRDPVNPNKLNAIRINGINADFLARKKYLYKLTTI